MYPWEIQVESCAARNAIVAPVSALSPEGGRMRVRIGALTAESTLEEVQRIGLRRGELARACFSPASTRLLTLTDEDRA